MSKQTDKPTASRPPEASADESPFTAEWALERVQIPTEPRPGAPASEWADYNAALSLAGRKRQRRQELGIGEFAKGVQRSSADDKRLALSLLDWHGGQSSGLYAVGSCMLSDAEKGRLYSPANHHGHTDTENAGALSRSISELRKLIHAVNHPELPTLIRQLEALK